MVIKKFQGKTEDEAVNTAKKELGQNIVIMNVKEMKRKGFFRFLKPHITEVTVALEEENASSFRAVTEDNISKESPFASITKEIMKNGAGEGNKNKYTEEPKLQEEKKEHSAGSMLEEKLDSIQSLIEQQLQRPEEKTGSDAKKELEEEETEEPDEMVVFMQLLYNTMIDNEVRETYANQIIDEAEKNRNKNMPIDYVLSNIYQKMILRFGKPEKITPAAEGPKVIFFVGPTGVGKTTTIAKIASKFSVEMKKKVALLTADTYRIAAAEQLRTYASILDDPFRVIYSAEEARTAIKDFREYDYIMIDTAGHSHHNEAQKENMNDLLHCLGNSVEQEVYLVLSATTKYRDLISIADTYSGITDYKIIFTKLDETTTMGNLLNLKLHTGAPLSYVTYGQNVPDDISYFNPQDTVRLLLGGKR
ncbi:MAG: flagellar biosynthesis protein FlhF [Lachnospiraceae bacterium]|nr:flagellar biosynthesis protein FlhF [Lachnospiraceae bacterium]